MSLTYHLQSNWQGEISDGPTIHQQEYYLSNCDRVQVCYGVW
jgi:hypothetical protein